MTGSATGLDGLLARAGINKAELARRLGVTQNAVQKWKAVAPRYAVAYLELLIEHNRIAENIRSLEAANLLKYEASTCS